MQTNSIATVVLKIKRMVVNKREMKKNKLSRVVIISRTNRWSHQRI